jgi:hypothetical protein
MWYFCTNKTSLSLRSWLPLAIFNPFISNLSPFNFYDYVLVVVDHLTKIGYFTFCTKTIIGEVICWSYFFIIMASLKTLFLIMDLNSHLSCGKGFLSF